jgi:Tfp pilus assembly protein PilO
MSDLFRSPKGKLGLVAAGGVLLLAAAWFLIVAPQRSKASKLSNEVTASRAELAQRRVALARPSAKVTVKPSDLYRLTKALPNETDMSGVLIDVDRVARTNKLSFTSITPSMQVPGAGYLEQPIAIVVQGRFGNVSNFLGDLRRLVSVRGGRLDARGRLYTVSKVVMSAPDSPTSYPVVKAAVTVNAYSFTQAPSVSNPNPSTTTDTSSSGTVAAGANP